MEVAGQQLGRAVTTWQASFPDRLMPLVLDIGGGGRNVANTIGVRGMKHVVDAIQSVKDSVHVTLVRAHSISLGDEGLKQVCNSVFGCMQFCGAAPTGCDRCLDQ
jgi:hypothetical protein